MKKDGVDNIDKKRILLLSGGMDSVYLYHLKKKYFDECVFFDYGQKNKKEELKRAKKANSDLKIIEMKNLKVNDEGFYFGRNLNFLIKLREKYIDNDLIIYIGSNADDSFPDSQREYFYRAEKLINDSYPNRLKVVTPLIDKCTHEIFEGLNEIDENIDFYHCAEGGKEPCGKCFSCSSLKSLGIFEETKR